MIGDSSGWSLLDPWFLALLPVIWALFAWRLFRARAALPVAQLDLVEGLPKTLRVRLAALPTILLALALSSFGVALSRPVNRDVLPIREKGVDIILVMDISSSMNAPDMDSEQTVTRIEVARERAMAFAAARTNDRVGLLTFARFPELRCPLTLDQDALAAFLRTVNTVPDRSAENTTAIGVALAKAVTLLEKSKAESRVVILLSDGENVEPDITPEDAAKMAQDAGIKVHCIGLGRGLVVETFMGRRRQPKPEFLSLKAIAKIVEGEFFEAESGEELAQVYERIDELEKVELEDPRYRTVDLFLYPTLLGAALLVLQWLLEILWIRRVP